MGACASTPVVAERDAELAAPVAAEPSLLLTKRSSTDHCRSSFSVTASSRGHSTSSSPFEQYGLIGKASGTIAARERGLDTISAPDLVFMLTARGAL